MKKLNLMLLLQLIVVLAWGQYSLNGTVKGNDESLVGASVVVKNTYYGQSTNQEGKFDFKSLKPGNYELQIKFIGFEEKTVNITLNENKTLQIELEPSVIFTDEVIVEGTRAKDKTPVAWTNVEKEQIDKTNTGQDIPYLLSLTPSFVPTSDAGAGVGYTGFRIRGTDMNRINVTLNGIPYNDAESHSTYFVDVPDLASSLENIQVQRGVGTSSNGAASFGATINLQTNTIIKDAYAEYKTAAGSFNTFKNTVAAGTGLIDGKFTFDARLSKVSSDGFIDRASSDLKSFFVSGAYYTGKTMVKINVFSGFEETYQSWWGVPSVRLNNDLKGMQQYEEHWLYSLKQTEEMINSDSRTYNYYTYENQVDHYQQDHYQLHFSHKFSQSLNFNTSIHYTNGRGYYENYKEDEDFTDYRMPYPIIGADTIFSTDLINRKWLVNDFYGAVFSVNYQKGKTDLTFGGGWSTYDGDHFGKVIWAEYYGSVDKNHDWYRGTGLKKDYNIYGKYNYQINNLLSIFTDLQFRYIDYKITGIDDNLRDIAQTHTFSFFNPKFGVFLKPSSNQDLYVSFARASREPNRSNYVDAPRGAEPPVHETLNDFEAGYNFRSSILSAGVNLYFMKYKNQLILTGEINDVGDGIMVNVDKSYRTGFEIMIGVKPVKNLQWDLNATFSSNKILDFTEYVDNWDTWGQEVYHLGKTDLAFSPKTIANSSINWKVAKKLNLNLISSFVGKQFIDNSSSENRSLDAWFVNNLNIDYSFKTTLFKEVKLRLIVNNILNEKYESNAWVYSYILGGERYKMDGYFPQAGRNFMVGVDIKY
ncbi:MAG: TonB-dependent receptor [Prolixibacteraceae bacterium]|nr:TonB-dependent receptor [Prolixibacteraceae bacterium]